MAFWLGLQWLMFIGLAALCIMIPPLGICAILVLLIGVMLDRRL